MIFNCWDNTSKKLVFKYSEPGDQHVCKRIENFNFKEDRGICSDNRFYTSKYHKESNLFFAFCIDKTVTRKPADFVVKHAINMFLSTNPAVEQKQKDYEEIVKTSVHNTKNLNSQITSKILNSLNERRLAQAEDKVEYIESLLKQNSYLFAWIFRTKLTPQNWT